MASETEESIQSIVREIIYLSEEWYRYLEEWEKGEKLLYLVAIGFITFSIILFPTIMAFSALLNPLAVPVPSYVKMLPIILPILASIVASIIFHIFYTKYKRRRSRYSELSSELFQIKSSEGLEKLSEATLRLIDKIMAFLPEIKRRKKDEALVYGFSITLILILLNPIMGTMGGLAPLAGIIVWAYLRYETMREHEKEVLKFDELRKRFEQEKDMFIKSL